MNPSQQQLPRAAQRIAAAVAAWWRQRRDRRQLLAMSEAELLDLGIGRSEVPSLMQSSLLGCAHRH